MLYLHQKQTCMNTLIATLSTTDSDFTGSYMLSAEGLSMVAATSESTTMFVGVADNEVFFNSINTKESSELLLRAVNNRTRERNYFRLYCSLLEGNISDEEFDKEIEENENLYVIDANKTPTVSQLETAAALAPKILNVDSQDDFFDIFSFSELKTAKMLSDGREE